MSGEQLEARPDKPRRGRRVAAPARQQVTLENALAAGRLASELKALLAARRAIAALGPDERVELALPGERPVDAIVSLSARWADLALAHVISVVHDEICKLGVLPPEEAP